MCSIPECETPSVIKDYCHKHYKRLKRHGDATIVLKAGRKREENSINRMVEHLFAEWSPRTQAMYAGGLKRCIAIADVLGLDPAELTNSLVAERIRPNGTFSVTGFAKATDYLAATLAIEMSDLEDGNVWDASTSQAAKQIKARLAVSK